MVDGKLVPVQLPPPKPAEKKLPPSGLADAGGTLLVLGGISVAVGAVIWLSGVSVDIHWHGDSGPTQEEKDKDAAQRSAGGWTMLAGGVLMGVGLPMLIVGRKQQREAAAPRAAALPARPRGAWEGQDAPVLIVGPRGAGLRLRF